MAIVPLKPIGTPREACSDDRSFARHRAGLQKLEQQLAERRAEVHSGWGKKYVDRVHAKGKLTARERLAALIDSGTEPLEVGTFVNYGVEFGDKGLITALTQWREFRDSDDAKADARFKDMLEQSKTKAQDMFEDFTEELHAKYQADRPVLKAAYKAAEKVDVTSCGLEAFAAAVRAHPPCADVADGHVALFYQELVKLAQEELEKKERRRVRAEKDFRRLVKKYVDRGKLQPTASYEDAVAVCGERSAWKDVAEAVRRELFAKLLEDIAKGADDEEEERSRCLTPPP